MECWNDGLPALPELPGRHECQLGQAARELTLASAREYWNGWDTTNENLWKIGMMEYTGNDKTTKTLWNIGIVEWWNHGNNTSMEYWDCCKTQMTNGKV